MTPERLVAIAKSYAESLQKRAGTPERFPADQLLGLATWAKFHRHLLCQECSTYWRLKTQK